MCEIFQLLVFILSLTKILANHRYPPLSFKSAVQRERGLRGDVTEFFEDEYDYDYEEEDVHSTEFDSSTVTIATEPENVLSDEDTEYHENTIHDTETEELKTEENTFIFVEQTEEEAQDVSYSGTESYTMTSTDISEEQSCQHEGQILPVREYHSVQNSCYKFKTCTLNNGSLEEITVTCPFGLEWKESTNECQVESEACRVSRLAEASPAWLDRLLSCPPTSSLPYSELSAIHMLTYYLTLNGSVQKQNDRQTDFLTPIVMDLGIFRHVDGQCNSYFRCIYTEKTPFVHVLNSAVYQRCNEGLMFNQDWNRCMNRESFEPYGRFRITHPDPDQMHMCMTT